MRVRVGQIRAAAIKGDLAANHAKLMSLLRGMAGDRPDVVVTPECLLDGYVVTESHVASENIADYGVDLQTAPQVAEARNWCRDNRVWLVLGCTAVDAEGAHNSAVVIDRDGRIIGRYDKVHCQRHDRKFVAGTSLPVFEGDFGTFGVMICADRRWPETVRTLAGRGARVIFNPSYGMHDELNLCMMRTRSFESEVFIVFTHPRQSLVTDPRGGVVVSEQEGEGVTFSELDLAQVDEVRRGDSAHLRDRRCDVYDS